MYDLIDYSGLTVNERITYARTLMMPSELAILSHDENVDVVITVLKNSNVSFETMLRCSSSPDNRIRSVVAEGPYSPILRELAKSQCFYVCICLAYNKKTPGESLHKLSLDESWQVRLGVAQNPNALYRTLSRLKDDTNIYVCEAAKENLASRIMKID